MVEHKHTHTHTFHLSKFHILMFSVLIFEHLEVKHRMQNISFNQKQNDIFSFFVFFLEPPPPNIPSETKRANKSSITQGIFKTRQTKMKNSFKYTHFKSSNTVFSNSINIVTNSDRV